MLRKVGSKHATSDTLKNILDKSCPVLMDKECVAVLAMRVAKELTDPSLSKTQEEEEEEFERCKKGLNLLKVLLCNTHTNRGLLLG